jgi:hypothetical protein
MLIGVMALGIVPNSSRLQVPEPPTRVLLTAAPLSDQITALTVTEYSGRCGGLNRNQGRAMVRPAFR